MVALRSSIALISEGEPRNTRNTRKIRENSRLVFVCFVCFVVYQMSDKLTEIMAWKRREIAPLLRDVSERELAKLDASAPRPPSFATALRRADGKLAIISEIKRRSPSAGEIKTGISALDQAKRYQAAGADALSVLTDEKYFGGTLDDLRNVTSYFSTTPPAAP